MPRLNTPSETAHWILTHPSHGLGRLLTVAKHLQDAQNGLQRLLGYLDSAAPEQDRVELGISALESRLLNVVKALDMVPRTEHPTPVETPVGKRRKS